MIKTTSHDALFGAFSHDFMRETGNAARENSKSSKILTLKGHIRHFSKLLMTLVFILIFDRDVLTRPEWS